MPANEIRRLGAGSVRPGGDAMTAPFEITRFQKERGALTKRIVPAADGSVQSDASPCLMSRGFARRVRLENAVALANLIDTIKSDEALSLGRLRHDLSDRVEVVTKRNGLTFISQFQICSIPMLSGRLAHCLNTCQCSFAARAV
jgi:hypothetical protein